MLLEGIRVIEWAETLPAAFGARILADLGAEVIKLERPGSGDPLRRLGPFLPDAPYGEASALFAYANHGKRMITLDTAAPSAIALLRRLLERSQLLIEAQPQRLLEEHHLTPAGLCRDNPALVVLSATAHGRTGAGQRADSDLTLAHYSGYAFHQARPVEDPTAQPPVAGADREASLAAGVACAAAALWGLLAAERTGIGTHIDCAEADVLAHLLIEPVADYARGERRFGRRRENLRGTEIAGGLVWLLPCRDGLVMVSPREQHQWDRWVGLLGNPDWSRDGRLCRDRAARTEHWQRLQDEMAKWTRQHTREAVFRRAQSARVACFPVSTPRDLLENAQLRDRGFFDALRTVSATALPMPGLPFRLCTSAGAALRRDRGVRAPALGEANIAILEDLLGVSSEEMETLRRHGVV